MVSDAQREEGYREASYLQGETGEVAHFPPLIRPVLGHSVLPGALLHPQLATRATLLPSLLPQSRWPSETPRILLVLRQSALLELYCSCTGLFTITVILPAQSTYLLCLLST